ncbi:MAG TPA: hypothetical protein PLD23_01310 [Armatimonadota bacterium]|nr:hypothetical protein [Armatimonadota bacterium]
MTPVFGVVAALVAAAPPDGLALYCPFDGSLEPLWCGEGMTRMPADLPLVPGMRGSAVHLVGDYAFSVDGAFPVAEGTFGLWVALDAIEDVDAPRYLMCIYGHPSVAESWMHNRFCLFVQGGRLTMQVFPREGAVASAQADVSAWQPGEWHHVAATWSGINSGQPRAALRLFADGEVVGESAGLQLDVGPTSTVWHVGRDSDNSADYGWAAFDDLFLYGRALPPDEIASGVAWVKAHTGATARVPAARQVPGWLAPELPFRATALVVPARRDRTDPVAHLPMGTGGTLGVPGGLEQLLPSVCRVFAEGTELAAEPAAGVVRWVVPGRIAAGEERHFDVYFGAARYAYAGPLQVTCEMPTTSASETALAPTDFATATFGDAWDFDEGDIEDIDQFGDKPDYIRNVRVEDGALQADVEQDAYIVWGSMWGPEDQGKRTFRLDPTEYNQLEIRLRQSVPWSQWDIMGRVAGTDGLAVYKFPVSGQGWQTIRIDLLRDANWRQPLSAFRIDLTNDMRAQVAVDWVRLTQGVPAELTGLQTLGAPSGVAAQVTLEVADRSPVAGSDQDVAARVTDAQGDPVAGQPVVIAIREGAGTIAESGTMALKAEGGLRGLTGPDGRFVVRYEAGRQAGSTDELIARTEFPDMGSEIIRATVQAGPPDHYIVLSPEPIIVPEVDTPLLVRAQVADVCGNPLPLEGRKLSWEVAEGQLDGAAPATAADGSATARLVPDMARRWVYTVRVTDDQGLTGQSGPVCVLPKGPRPDRVRLGDNGYFTTGPGQPFVPLGGFYGVWVPGIAAPGQEKGRAIHAFHEATEEEILDWFGFLQAQGITAIRMMLRTHGPDGTEAMDIGGRVNRRLFATTLRYFDLARRFGLRFMLTLHDDYDKPVYCNARHLKRFALPAFAGEDLNALPAFQRRFIRDQELVAPAERYTDPDAIACQDQYAREIVGYLKDNPVVFSWELENEMVDCPVSWVNHAVDVIREVDPDTPVCVSHGGGGIVTSDPLYWTTQSNVDFYTYHLYPVGMTRPETDYGAAVDLLTRYGRMAGTCFMGESAGDEFSSYPPERDRDRRYVMRDIIWFGLVNGNPGSFFWNARGFEVEEFRLARALMDRIDWTAFERRRPTIAVLVDHPLDDDKHWRSPGGQAEMRVMEQYVQHFLSLGVDFDFATDAAGYATVCGVAAFEPPALTGGRRVSPGYQLASLTRADGQQGLAYARNFAGIVAWEVKAGQTMWLRQRAKARLVALLGAELQGAEVIAVDLDTAEERVMKAGADGSVDLGESEHDFALLWGAAR